MLKSVSSDSSNKLGMINDKIKGECSDLTQKKERLHKEKEELDEKISTLSNEYHSEKKEREKLENTVSQLQNESGLNLYNLRKKLQSYVWDDMYAWNVLLDIKTDFSLEDLHEEKLQEIRDLQFVEQVQKIDSDIAVENIRLVELKEEREKEKHSDPMYIDTELDIDLETTKTPRGEGEPEVVEKPKPKKSTVDKKDKPKKSTGGKKTKVEKTKKKKGEDKSDDE